MFLGFVVIFVGTRLSAAERLDRVDERRQLILFRLRPRRERFWTLQIAAAQRLDQINMRREVVGVERGEHVILFERGMCLRQ